MKTTSLKLAKIFYNFGETAQPLQAITVAFITMLILSLAFIWPNVTSSAFATEATNEPNTATEQTFAVTPQAQANDLQLTCTYTTPVVGSPTTFTLQGSGGSGNYKYLQNYIRVLIDGTFTDDADWSRKSYTTDNTFTYTFVAPGTYELRLYIMDMDSSPIKTARTIFRVTVGSDSNNLTVEQKANEIAQAALDAGCSTDYEKALYVHDWLITHATYDYSLEFDGESGVLLRGKGTCESFYRAYALVLKHLGIQSERAIGNGHVWNRLLLDGEWTHVDATWDAGNSLTGDRAYLSHLYFGLTDEMIKEAHNEYIVTEGQEATSYNSNYFLQSGEVALWADDLCASIEQALNEGVTYLEVAAPYNAYPNMYSVMGRAAAYYASNKDWGPYDVDVALKLQGNLNQSSVFCITISEKDKDPEPPSIPSKPTTPDNESSGGTVIPDNNGSSSEGSPTSPDSTTDNNQSETDTPDKMPPSSTSPDKNDSTSNGTTGNSGSNSSSSGNTGASGSTTNTPSEGTSSSADSNDTNGTTNLTAGQWVKDSNGWWYQYTDGTYPRNSWQLINNRWYYFSKSGYMQTGWQKIGKTWYYLSPRSGAMQTGWLHKGAWYYLLPDSGAMATGWQKIDGVWYYLLPDSGAMATGWQKIDGVWYYLKRSGALATGWQYSHGKWYYLRSSGAMQTGWLHKGAWYYLLPDSGAMATGWQKIGNSWYYFYNSGAMAANTSIGSYYIDGTGAWIS